MKRMQAKAIAIALPFRETARKREWVVPGYGFAAFALTIQRVAAGAADFFAINVTVQIMMALGKAAGLPIVSPKFGELPSFTHYFAIEACWLAAYVFYWSRWQRTPGMWLMRLKLVAEDGKSKPSLGNVVSTYAVLSFFLLASLRSLELFSALHPDVTSLYAKLLATVCTKELLLVMIAPPIFLTAGERNLANLVGRTRIVSTMKPPKAKKN